MHFATFFLPALMAVSDAYVIKIYREHGCKGESFELNVWNGSCATPRKGEWNSFEPVTQGGTLEYMTASKTDSCHTSAEITLYKKRLRDITALNTDGGNWKFTNNNKLCHELSSPAKAFQSVWLPLGGGPRTRAGV